MYGNQDFIAYLACHTGNLRERSEICNKYNALAVSYPEKCRYKSRRFTIFRHEMRLVYKVTSRLCVGELFLVDFLIFQVARKQ